MSLFVIVPVTIFIGAILSQFIVRFFKVNIAGPVAILDSITTVIKDSCYRLGCFTASVYNYIYTHLADVIRIFLESVFEVCGSLFGLFTAWMYYFKGYYDIVIKSHISCLVMAVGGLLAYEMLLGV